MQEKPLILCSVDLLDPRKKVCAFAKQYAEANGTDIAVLTVMPQQLLLYGMAHTNLSEHILDEKPTKDQQAALDAYVAENFAGLSVRAVVKTGPVADTILAFARQNHVQAIIMGTHGRKNLNRLIFGSVASQIVAGAGDIPVITIGTDK